MPRDPLKSPADRLLRQGWILEEAQRHGVELALIPAVKLREQRFVVLPVDEGEIEGQHTGHPPSAFFHYSIFGKDVV